MALRGGRVQPRLGRSERPLPLAALQARRHEVAELPLTLAGGGDARARLRARLLLGRARHPERHAHLVAIGLLGKVLGPIGFAWAAAWDRLPLAFGWTILTNDLVWWIPFALYLRDAARLSGGWRPFLSGA